MRVETTLSLASSGFTTPPHCLDGRVRLAVKVEVPSGDAAGVFHLVTKVTPNAQWDRHPTLTKVKTAGNSLAWRLDWAENCGYQVAIEYVRSSGGVAQEAAIFMCLD